MCVLGVGGGIGGSWYDKLHFELVGKVALAEDQCNLEGYVINYKIF